MERRFKEEKRRHKEVIHPGLCSLVGEWKEGRMEDARYGFSFHSTIVEDD
jgi:hypothetical protein